MARDDLSEGREIEFYDRQKYAVAARDYVAAALNGAAAPSPIGHFARRPDPSADWSPSPRNLAMADDHGARQADYVLAIVRGIMNWQATRLDDYVPPIMRGMRRTKPKERARTRKLTDDELRAVWKVAEGNGAFGALVRLLLLTAQRRDKVVSMRWQDISIDGTWTIPTEEGEKGNATELVLPKLALDVVRAHPQFSNNPYVLAGRGGGHINGFSKSKLAFDEKVAAKLPDVPQWQLHDLRRTARSLMSRAGVSSEHAEKVMGHKIEGVEGVYDRHEYMTEKRDALARLATLIDNIVNGRSAEVVPMLSAVAADR